MSEVFKTKTGCPSYFFWTEQACKWQKTPEERARADKEYRKDLERRLNSSKE